MITIESGITIEPGNANLAEDFSTLLQAELTNPDSIEAIRFALSESPSYVAIDRRRELRGLLYTLALSNDVLHIHGLHVHTDFRKQNIGSHLLETTEDRARSLGFFLMTVTNSMWYQGVDKRSAVRFYKKHGYKIKDKTDNSPPTYWMSKKL